MNKISVNLISEFREFLSGFGKFVETIAFTPYGQSKIRPIPRTTYYYKIRKFRKNNLIHKTQNNHYQLTNKAVRLIKKTQLYKRRSDGLSTIILFDIPESMRKERNILRRFLINHKFTQIQKSVLISPHRTNRELLDLINELKLRAYIKILGAKIEY